MTRHRLRFLVVLVGIGLALSAADRPGRPAAPDLSIIPAKAFLRLVLDAGIPAGAVEAAYAFEKRLKKEK